MDALDRIDQPARLLLGRVDAALAAAGVPAGHPALPLLREMRALPGDVFAAVAALRPESVRAGAAAVAPLVHRYQVDHAALAQPPDGAGVAAEVLRARCAALAAHLAGGSSTDTIAGRLSATERYLVDVADWMRESRLLMAETVARCMGSSDVVLLHTAPAADAGAALAAFLTGGPSWPGGSREVSRAAASMTVRVLLAGRTCHRAGLRLYDHWSGALVESPYRAAPSWNGTGAAPVTWLPL